jgi:hypothetical protein
MGLCFFLTVNQGDWQLRPVIFKSPGVCHNIDNPKKMTIFLFPSQNDLPISLLGGA